MQSLNKMVLSICIPTYNRAKYLDNCLFSILNSNFSKNLPFEICISDNNSDDLTNSIVLKYQSILPIVYSRNEQNIGMAPNFLKVVSMATGQFVWMIGDDDLIVKNSIGELFSLFDKYKNVDFFYLNSFHLNKEFLNDFGHPFHTNNLPSQMKTFSNYPISKSLHFIKLIDPKISFDFLGGIYLCVFKKTNWNEGLKYLDLGKASDSRTFSYFENTFPHIKIFANGFKNSLAFYSKECFTVNLHGVREWSNYYPLIRCIRLPEALFEYKKNGLSSLNYYKYNNQIALDFIPNFLYMFKNKASTGFDYIHPMRLIFKNMKFINFYFSVIKYLYYKTFKSVFLQNGNK
jgi:glycosyltransferase involved in cell wall biosynthesis